MAEITSAPSAGAVSTAGAGAPAPSVPSAPSEPVSLEAAAHEAMSGEDPADGGPEGTAAANPAGEGEGAPTPEEGGGDPTEKAPEEGAGAEDGADELAELDMADLPAARKEYLKRDPEVRAAWYFKEQMNRLKMTVPEAREFRKVFSSPADAGVALKRASNYRTIERALSSDAPDAPLHALEAMRQQFGTGAERLVRTVAQHIDKVDPQGALVRDATKLAELFDGLQPSDAFEKEAIETVWSMLEKTTQKPAYQRPPDDPEKRELQQLRAERQQGVQQAQREMFAGATKAGEEALRSVLETALAPARKLNVDKQILNDIGEGVFGEVRKLLVESETFQDQFINTLTDRARSPKQRREAAVALVKRWGESHILDKTAARLRPYTRSVVKSSRERLSHARDVSTLADLGGTAAAAGTPVRVPDDISLVDAARLSMR